MHASVINSTLFLEVGIQHATLAYTSTWHAHSLVRDQKPNKVKNATSSWTDVQMFKRVLGFFFNLSEGLIILLGLYNRQGDGICFTGVSSVS